jgi:hypothetical protein
VLGWRDVWLSSVELRVRPSTLRRYTSCLDRLDVLGPNLTMADTKGVHIGVVLDSVRADGRSEGPRSTCSR